MALERTRRNNKVCTSFMYGWDKFCASNHLNVSDTCFFNMIREATCSDNEDEEWERSRTMMKLSSRWRCTRRMADGCGELGTRVDTICILLFHQKYYLAYQDFLVLSYLDGL
jgi:hypothetical protein